MHINLNRGLDPGLHGQQLSKTFLRHKNKQPFRFVSIF